MKIKLFFYYWIPVIAYMLIIFYFPSQSIVNIENALEEKMGLQVQRWVMHIIEYAILSFLLYRALMKSRFGKHSWILAIVISIFYGFVDEVHQIFIIGRYFDFLDLFFDSVGSFLMQILIKIKNKIL